MTNGGENKLIQCCVEIEQTPSVSCWNRLLSDTDLLVDPCMWFTATKVPRVVVNIFAHTYAKGLCFMLTHT